MLIKPARHRLPNEPKPCPVRECPHNDNGVCPSPQKMRRHGVGASCRSWQTVYTINLLRLEEHGVRILLETDPDNSRLPWCWVAQDVLHCGYLSRTDAMRDALAWLNQLPKG